MQITRINRFYAAEGMSHSLLRFLKAVLADLEKAQGLVSCQLLQSAEAPRDIAVIEVWESIHDHMEAAKLIAPERLADVLPLLDAPPTGSYYSVAKSIAKESEAAHPTI